MDPLNIGIAASSERGDRERARRFVSVLPYYVRVILGGYWGLMKDVAEEAAERGLTVVFVLPEWERQTPPPRREFIQIRTGMEFRARSVPLTKSSDVLVVLGGESGTIIEAYMAYAMGKPVVILRNTGMSSDLLPVRLDSRGSAPVLEARTPEEAGILALKSLTLLTSHENRSSWTRGYGVENRG